MICVPPAPAATTGLKTKSLQKLRGHLSALVHRLGKPSRLQRCTTLDRLAERCGCCETVWRVLKKIPSTEVPYDPAIPLQN